MNANANRDQRAVPFRALALAGLIVLALAAVGAYVAYVELIHYERRALAHLPEGAELAGRIDVERVVLFDPVRRHLLPLINELPLAPDGADADAGPDRLTRLRTAADLNLALDLREIGFASANHGEDWVIVLGGLFSRSGLIDRIGTVLREEGARGVRASHEMLIFQPWGAALGQAADGVLILASRPEVLQSALPASTRFEQLALPLEGAGSLAASPSWLSNNASLVGADAPWFADIARLVLTIAVEADIQVQGRIDLRSSDPAQVQAGLASWRALHRPTGSPGDASVDWSEEWGLWARAQHLKSTQNTIQFDTYWHRGELDHAARNLASWLERRFSAKSPAGS